MFFWNSLAFSMIQRMLAIWSLVPLPFLKPAWTSESSRLTFFRLAHNKEIKVSQDEKRNAAHKLWIFWEWFFEEFFTYKYIRPIFQIHSLPFGITHYAVMWAVIPFISSTLGHNILKLQAYLFIMNISTENIGRPSIQ